ncbi:hypothetical protein [Azospirillum thermophilum]|uniref:hypothetical protein n=1 Tax=Azospirillum thermophilum TaxID=2202148 RepID=UPI00143D72D4|nr:hypothetical protein [Azospirillum thermophilum]
MVDAVAATLATAMAGDQELANAERAGHFREAVAALSGLFLKAPADVGVAFRDLHEDALAAESSNWIRRFEQGTFRPEFHGTAQKDTLAAGAFLRALDRELHDARPHLGAVSDPGAAYRTPSGTAYVVPRAIPRSATRRSQPFQKRGLLFNRVLPAEIAGLPVRLTEQRVARTPDQPPLFGAALFKDYELKIASTGAGFLVTGVDCPDQLDAIRRQLDTALDAGCTVVTWPELMIPAEARDHIAETLSGFALERGSGKVPALVVAGTWHERQEGGQQPAGGPSLVRRPVGLGEQPDVLQESTGEGKATEHGGSVRRARSMQTPYHPSGGLAQEIGVKPLSGSGAS